MAYKKRKKGNIFGVVGGRKIILVLVFVLVILFAILLAVVGIKKGASKTGDSTQDAKQEDNALKFPYSLEDGKIEIASLFQYSGTNPDCNDEMGEDIASLEIVNKSDEYLEKADFTVELADKTSITFAVTDVPAGKTVWAYATDNTSYDLSTGCKSVTCDASFEKETPLMEDEVEVKVKETEVILTNKSGEELKNLNVSCHCLFEEAYFGGLTYTYPVESIPAGESTTVQAEECYMGEAEVVRIGQGDR